MQLYFYVHDPRQFHDRIGPALAASWHARSFEPCRDLCASLAASASAFTQRFRTAREDPLLCRIGQGVPFSRDLWRFLVGEVLLYGASELPELATAPDLLCRLLAPGKAEPGDLPRAQFAPIHQAHFGRRDLILGGFYRPAHAGWNDEPDIVELTAYLTQVDSSGWTSTDVGPALDEEDAEEELAFARHCLSQLGDLYRRVGGAGQLLVCEVL